MIRPASAPSTTAQLDPPPRRGQARQPRARARRAIRCPARPASPIRAGRRTARRPTTMPTRTSTGEVALVHNGIIENFKPLRDELIARGRVFESETDTEVVAHLVSEQVERGASPARGGRGGAAAAARRLRARDPVPPASRPADRRAARLAAGRRLRRRRDLSRLGRAGARAADPAHRLSRRGRLGRRHARRRADLRPRQQSGRARDHHLGRDRRD